MPLLFLGSLMYCYSNLGHNFSVIHKDITRILKNSIVVRRVQYTYQNQACLELGHYNSSSSPTLIFVWVYVYLFYPFGSFILS